MRRHEAAAEDDAGLLWVNVQGEKVHSKCSSNVIHNVRCFILIHVRESRLTDFIEYLTFIFLPGDDCVVYLFDDS